jgi:hypothetical protein
MTASPKVIFTLDPDKIQENDIVVLLDSVTGHAALCTQPHLLFEATLDGLHRRLVFTTHVKKRDQIHVRRPKTAPASNADGLTVSDLAEMFYGNAYGLATVAQFPLPKLLTYTPKGKFFCSQIIAKLFLECGTDLLPGISPEKVSPKSLLQSLELKCVTDECLVEIDPAKQPLDYESVMEAEEKSLWAGREMKMNRRVFDASMKKLGKQKPKDVHNLRELWTWLGYRVGRIEEATVLGFEAQIFEAMETKGYWEFYRQMHFRSLADADSLKAETTKLLNRSADIAQVDAWLRCNEPAGVTLLKRRQYLQAFRDWHSATRLELFRLLAEVFETMVDDVETIQANHEQLLAAHTLKSGSA